MCIWIVFNISYQRQLDASNTVYYKKKNYSKRIQTPFSTDQTQIRPRAESNWHSRLWQHFISTRKMERLKYWNAKSFKYTQTLTLMQTFSPCMSYHPLCFWQYTIYTTPLRRFTCIYFFFVIFCTTNSNCSRFSSICEAVTNNRCESNPKRPTIWNKFPVYSLWICNFFTINLVSEYTRKKWIAKGEMLLFVIMALEYVKK